MAKVCITGITGQVGSYLAELCLQEGHQVFGLKRSSSSFNSERIDHLYQDPHINDQLKLVYGDLSDYSSIASFVSETQPEYFINCAALSHVRVSFDIPEYAMDITGAGVVRCLEAIRRYSPKTRFLQMSTSELFGDSPPPQKEDTPFRPRSPYAVAKLAGYWATVNYREAYGLHASNAIAFNNESPRRAENFVTRKITRAATRIKLGLQDKLYLGNLDAQRDWGFSGDTVRGVWAILNAETPDDFCIATGEMHSVREFLELVFSKLDLDWQEYVEFDSKYLRPTEVDALCGDPSKIKSQLGWEPQVSFEQLVAMMVEHDLQLASKELLLKSNGK